MSRHALPSALLATLLLAASGCEMFDYDGDHLVGELDCDNHDPRVGGPKQWSIDGDGDGFGTFSAFVECSSPVNFVADATDCDDSAASVNPNSAEVCDGIDNDCDGAVDEEGGSLRYADTDGDGYGDNASSVASCVSVEGAVDNAGDCDDADPWVHPEADEICNGVDDDCDGSTDEGASGVQPFWRDADGDGFGDPLEATSSCIAPDGYVSDDRDCDDDDGAIHPDTRELCDGLDNDCDGSVDSGGVTYDFDMGLDASWMAQVGHAQSSFDGADGYLELANADIYSVGAAWMVDRRGAEDFEVSFDFALHGGSGGDGLTFAWLADSNLVAIGQAGEGLGVGGLNGYAVEFDTFYNAARDADENHVALIDPLTMSNYATAAVATELEDSGWHQAQIRVSNGNVQVYVDSRLYIDTDLPDYTMPDAMMGFTGSSGVSTNFHDIDNVTMPCR